MSRDVSGGARWLAVAIALGSATLGCVGGDGDLASAESDLTEALRVRAVGDVMMGTDFPASYLPPDDGATLLASVAGELASADLTFANLEGPLCDGGTTDKCAPGQNCYAFRTPTRYGAYLSDAGLDVASLANNHALDFGEACREETARTLDALGIAHSGPKGTVATLTHGDLSIGLIAFHTANHSNDVRDIDAAIALVEEVDATHDLVFVSFHGGAEGEAALHVPNGPERFYGEARGDLRRFAHAVVDAGADLVLGHGPHVPRAMEVYQGRLVAYSLGNFATYGRFSLTGNKAVSLILDASLDREGRFISGALLPVRLVDGGFPVPDPSGAAIALVGELSATDFPDTGVLVDASGAIRPNL
jgi:poly-gamma-glutamate capsule biosynthesis protein CapA/YwtB (metallophosphatase superfamily)